MTAASIVKGCYSNYRISTEDMVGIWTVGYGNCKISTLYQLEIFTEYFQSIIYFFFKWKKREHCVKLFRITIK